MLDRQKDRTIQHTASMVAPLCDPRLSSVQGLWRVGTGPHQGEICSTFCWFSMDILSARWSLETSFLALASSFSRMEGAFMMAAWAAGNDVEIVRMTQCAGLIRAPRMAICTTRWSSTFAHHGRFKFCLSCRIQDSSCSIATLVCFVMTGG